MMAFFPFYIENKRADIRNQEVLRASLEKNYQLKLLELQEAMGETKVIDNFKEKKQKEHRKALEKKELEESLEAGREALKGDDAQAIEQATEKITQASHKLAELMYKQQAESAEAQGDGSPEQPEAPSDEAAESSEQDKKDGDDVIDAEFTEK